MSDYYIALLKVGCVVLFKLPVKNVLPLYALCAHGPNFIPRLFFPPNETKFLPFYSVKSNEFFLDLPLARAPFLWKDSVHNNYYVQSLTECLIEHLNA